MIVGMDMSTGRKVIELREEYGEEVLLANWLPRPEPGLALHRELIGESIPPAGFHFILEHLRDILAGTARSSWFEREAPLFAPVTATG